MLAGSISPGCLAVRVLARFMSQLFAIAASTRLRWKDSGSTVYVRRREGRRTEKPLVSKQSINRIGRNTTRSATDPRMVFLPADRSVQRIKRAAKRWAELIGIGRAAQSQVFRDAQECWVLSGSHRGRSPSAWDSCVHAEDSHCSRLGREACSVRRLRFG